MHPVLLKFGPFSIYSYGVMLAFGFGLSILLIYNRSAGFGLDRDKMVDLSIFIFLAGIIGARIFYVLLNISHYLERPLEILDLSKGGLVWYGGFLSGLLTAICYILKNRLYVWSVFDLISPYIALAQSLGRIGCFLNGCCFGVEAPLSYPFAVIFPDSFTPLYPTQVYSSLALILIFIILRIWQDRRHFYGEIFLGYCILYSSKRFFLEFLRGDNAKIFLNLTISQVISLAVFLVSIAIFISRAAKWKSALTRSR